MRALHTLLIASLVVAAHSAPARANQKHHTDKDQAQLIVKAQQVLTEAVTAPDQGIPKDLLAKAECVGVFPGLKKGAFVVGGEYGHGVFTCRENNGMMGAPAFFTLGSGSVGWQFGGESADVVLLIMNPTGV